MGDVSAAPAGSRPSARRAPEMERSGVDVLEIRRGNALESKAFCPFEAVNRWSDLRETAYLTAPYTTIFPRLRPLPPGSSGFYLPRDLPVPAHGFAPTDRPGGRAALAVLIGASAQEGTEPTWASRCRYPNGGGLNIA
jgi:hypothetical protein